MITMLMKTDKPQAELYLYKDAKKLREITWQAHRELSDTLLSKIHELLASENYTLHDVNKIGVFRGPGSFTGLRIGIATANSLAYALRIPIVSSVEDDWAEYCLAKQDDEGTVTPEYGAEPHITQQKK